MNVPQLRFPGFRDEWVNYELKNILSLVKDGSHGTHKDVDVGPYLLSAKNLYNGMIHYDDTDRKISLEDFNSIYKNYKLKKDDILLSIVGTIGRTAIVKKEELIAFQRSVAILRGENTYPLFLHYLLQSPNFQKQLKIKQVVSAQPGLYLGDLSKIKVDVPQFQEQQFIGDFFKRLSNKTELQLEKVDLLKQQKKGYMQKIFRQELRFQDENGKDFPDWETNKLSHYLYEHKVRNYKGIYSKHDVLSVSGEYGIVNQIEFQGRSFAGKSVANYHVVHNGDIVYTKSPLKSNPYGIIKCNKGITGIVSTLYAVYSCKENILGEFLNYYFQLDGHTNSYLRPLVNKGAKNDMKINNENVLKGEITLPLIKEQQKIIQFLSTIDKKIKLEKGKYEKLDQQKKSYMQQMFS